MPRVLRVGALQKKNEELFDLLQQLNLSRSRYSVIAYKMPTCCCRYPYLIRYLGLLKWTGYNLLYVDVDGDDVETNSFVCRPAANSCPTPSPWVGEEVGLPRGSS